MPAQPGSHLVLGKLALDFKTNADFRRDHRASFNLVHRQFHLLCHQLKLFGGELIALDGTKLAGVTNACGTYLRAKKLRRLPWRSGRVAASAR